MYLILLLFFIHLILLVFILSDRSFWQHSKPFLIVIPGPNRYSPASILHLVQSIDSISRFNRHPEIIQIDRRVLEEERHPGPIAKFTLPARQQIVASQELPTRTPVTCQSLSHNARYGSSAASFAIRVDA